MDNKRRIKKTAFAFGFGAVAGFLGAAAVLLVGDAGQLGALNTSREIALMVGITYIVIAAIIALGLVLPKFGARFMNVEDADELRELRAMLTYSAGGLLLIGIGVIVVALAGPGGAIAPAVALAAYIALSIVTLWFSLRAYRLQDELMAAMGNEVAGLSFSLIALIGGSWAVLAHLGFVLAPAPLDWLTMMIALPLLAAIVVTMRRGLFFMR